MNKYRYYQKEADVAIYNELLINNKCIVKMFCGTGKSLLMRKCKIIEKKKLVVYVFPSLGLIDQFCSDYFVNVGLSCPFKISSENESTTDPIQIKAELKNKKQKIICVTYQSYKTLLDNLDSTKIDVCIYDEAHHAVGETYQKFIFENDMNYCEKQIFFTATPKNANGIVMYDRDNLDAGMCGNLVYDYSYLKGVVEDYLNPFEIRMDMYTENTNNSVFESIARAILVSGNNRVLTFHSDVNTDRDTSVKNFVNEREFKNIFKKIQKSEFPEKKGTYKKFKMIALDKDIKMDDRRTILNDFDKTLDDEVMVISSCETIGEGIDTKNANMCVFVDPKSSHVKITQNIGRIVRKIFGSNKPNSTILIPCWVDKTKYLDCGGDKDKCDEVIRQDMSKGGNFNGILNVMSALKQEDEDIHDICLHYLDRYSPQEIKGNLEKQGYKILEPVGDGTMLENIEYLIGEDLDYEDFEDCDDDEEMIMRIAEDHDICIEIHTDSLETPVETYNSECESGEIIRLYKCRDDDDEKDIYCPIVKKCGKRKNKGSIQGLNRNQRVKISEHTNPDVKVLWNIVGDFTKDICSCILDCEVVDKVELWLINLQKLDDYIVENKKTPSQCDKNREIKTLSKWLTQQKQNYKNKKHNMKNEKIKIKWEEFIEKHKEYFMSNEEEWKLKLKELDDYIVENEKRPSIKDKNIEIESLAIWIYTQTQNYKNKKQIMTDENIRNKWEEFVEKHKEHFTTLDEKWYINLQKADNYLIDNKEKPSIKDKNIEIESLARWIYHQTNSYKDKKHAMNNDNIRKKWEEFVEKHKEHFILNDDNWIVNYQKSDEYIIKNKKTPSTRDKNEEIKSLGNWISNQNKKYKYEIEKNKDETENMKDNETENMRDNSGNMKDNNIRKKWEEFLEKHKEHFISKKEYWEINLQKTDDYIFKHKKKPSTHDKNKDIVKIARWIGTQASSYRHKKYFMKDEDIRKTWKKFVEKYKEHFEDHLKEIILLELEEDKTPELEKPKPKKSMKLKTPSVKKETIEQRKQRTKSELSILHQRYKTLTSPNLQKEFQKNPQLWHKYHEISEENEKSFPEQDIPRNRIIQELDKIKTKRTKKVVDMGCGKAQIANHFEKDSRFQFINYDHISSSENIETCDISNTPLEENDVEICILSLAMWGSNCKEYIQESHRILETGGKLYIIEATKRWTEEDELPGNKLKKILEENGFQIVEEKIEKFCMFVCIKV